MGFFNRKEEKRIPNFPSSEDTDFFDSVEELKSDESVLPSFPDSPTHNKFSEAMIKDAVSQPSNNDGLTEVPQDEKKIKVVEMQEWEPSDETNEDEDNEGEHHRFMPPPELNSPSISSGLRTPLGEPPTFAPRRETSGKDVFVRIDKYYTARKALSEISEKLEEINDMVKKIREVKLREEQELASWERDIMNAKMRIKEVGDNLFNKTDEN